MTFSVANVVLSFHAVVSAAIVGISHTALKYFLYLHSYLTSILISMLVVLSGLFPCGYYAAAAVSAKGLIILLHFITMLSIIANSFLIGHYYTML